MSISQNFPDEGPTLSLNFASSKTLDPRITFTRASTGTYTDDSGLVVIAPTNAPRFDHNPTTGESLGLLVEEARTNLRTYSDAILSANSYGIPNSTLTTASITNPFGGTTASLLTLNVGANTGNNIDGFNFGSGISIANSTAHAQSLFVKPAGATVLRLRSNVGGALFDFTLTGNGIAPSPAGDLQSASIVLFPNGWYRVSWTFTSTTSAPGNRGDYWAIKTNVADGTSGLHVWGAQLEAGAFPTSYIPTTTAAATRSADVASITGSAFSSWYRQDEETLFASATAAVAASILPCYASIDNGTTSERLQLRRVTSGTIPSYRVVAGGQSIDSATKTIGSPTGFNSHVLAYASSNYEGACNGTLEGLISIVNRPTATQLQIGNGAGNAALNGTIRRLTYWPTRLSDTILQTLTK